MRINVTLPVYNAEKWLVESVHSVARFMSETKYDYEITIANNASTDRTLLIAQGLAKEVVNVRLIHSEIKGRGAAIKKSWQKSGADIVSYMDIDLSTDINCFPDLIEPLALGKHDLATGSRLMPNAKTTRCIKRQCLSLGYNALVRKAFSTKFTDAQCGFKAMTKKAADFLLPLVMDTQWFFDTELLVLAEKNNYRICDVPVKWVENSDSRVRILSTINEDLKGIIRLRKSLIFNRSPIRKIENTAI